MSNRIQTRQSLQPRSPRQPMSPRLKPPDPTIPQSKKDKVTSTFLSLANQKTATLTQLAQASHLLYLDLENNLFTAETLHNLPKGLTALNLVSNPLGSCALPLLEKLRSLSLDNCGLTSFSSFPPFANLRFLSVANNQIKNFHHLPILPKLECFNIENNAYDFPTKMIIAAVGSISINNINGIEITEEDLSEAYKMSPLVGYSLRQGREPKIVGTPDDEVKFSQEFLTKELASVLEQNGNDKEEAPLSLNVLTYNGEPCLMCPWKGQASVKWYCSHQPVNGNEWRIVQNSEDNTQGSPRRKKIEKDPNILPITMMLRMHLVKCEIVLYNQKFCLYTDYPIGYQQGQDLLLPFPLSPVIAGLSIEKSLISLIPLPIPVRLAWLRDKETIAEDVTSITLTELDIKKRIMCLLQPYCPKFPTVSFATVFVETEEVEPFAPTVAGVTFPEVIIEGEKITFTRRLYPDREGDSQIIVERAKSPSGEWTMVDTIPPSDFVYTPSHYDVGCYLRISYTPVSAGEGSGIGPTVFFYSQTKVLPTLPVFKHAMIGGLPKTNYPLVAVGNYQGGRMGHCSYRWFFSKVPITGQNIQSLECIAEDTRVFIPTDDMEDGYLAVEMVPIREDDVIGDPAYAALVDPIVKDDPPKPLDNVPEEVVEDETIEFPEPVIWYISDPEGFCGFKEVKRGPIFTPHAKHIGKVLRIVTNNSDVIVGEVQPSKPAITGIKIEASAYEEGRDAEVIIESLNTTPEMFEIIWIRCKGQIEKAVGYNCTVYHITGDDVGFHLKVRVSIILDKVRITPFESPLTSIVKAGPKAAPVITGKLVEFNTISVKCGKEVDSENVSWFRSGSKDKWIPVDEDYHDIHYQLGVEDIGHYMRARVQIGEISVIATSSDVVKASFPTANIHFPKETYIENEIIRPVIYYTGGVEGESVYRWERETDSGWFKLSMDKEIQTTKEDVGHLIRLTYTPVRKDGTQGKPIQLEIGPIEALPPKVTNVVLRQNERGQIEVSGKYSGGIEGQSIILWRAIPPEGKIINVGRTYEKFIVPTKQLMDYSVTAIYTPVREDGEQGTPVEAKEPLKITPLPSITNIEMIFHQGLIEVGSLIRARVDYSYGDHSTFQWWRGDGAQQWEEIPGATDFEYTPTEADVGLILLCEAFPYNKSNWVGKPASAMTPSPVEPSEIKLSIVAVGKEDAKDEDKYVTGIVLKANINENVRWQREEEGEWCNVSTGVSYIVTANDVGHKIKIKLGAIESEPTPVIKMDKGIVSLCKAAIRAKSLVFASTAKLGKSLWHVVANSQGLKMKQKKTGNEKSCTWATCKCEAVPNTENEMILWVDPSTKFVLIPSFSDDPRLAKITGQKCRDFVVSFISAFSK